MSDPYSFKAINPLWALAETLTVRQAAALIAGFDPNAVEASGNYFVNRETGVTDSVGIGGLHTALAALVNAINARTLKATIRRSAWRRGWDEEPEEGEAYAESFAIRDDDTNEARGFTMPRPGSRRIIYRVSPDWDLTTITVESLKQWLAQRGVRPAFFFAAATDTPDYLDRYHPRYAPKLAAAVTAWLAVTDPGKKTPKQALEKWLREHAAEYGLTDENGNPVARSIEECCRVANWERGGGAPRTVIS